MNITEEVRLFAQALHERDPDLGRMFTHGDWAGLNQSEKPAAVRLRRILKYNFKQEYNRSIFREVSSSSTAVFKKFFVDPDGHSAQINTHYADRLIREKRGALLLCQRMMVPWDLPGNKSSLATMRANMAGFISGQLFLPAVRYLETAVQITTNLTQSVERAEERVNSVWSQNCAKIDAKKGIARALAVGVVKTFLPAFLTTPMAQFINTYLSHWADVAGANALEEQPSAAVTYDQAQQFAGLQPGQTLAVNFSKGPNKRFYGGNWNKDGDDAINGATQWFMEGLVNAGNNFFGQCSDGAKDWLIKKIQTVQTPNKNTELGISTLVQRLTEVLCGMSDEFKRIQDITKNDLWLIRKLTHYAVFESRGIWQGVSVPRAGAHLFDILNNAQDQQPEQFLPKLPHLPRWTQQMGTIVETNLTRLLLRERMARNHPYYVQPVAARGIQITNPTQVDLSRFDTKCLDHKHDINDALIQALVALNVLTIDKSVKQADRDKIMHHNFAEGEMYFGKKCRAHNTKLLFKDWVFSQAVEEQYLAALHTGLMGQQPPPRPPLVFNESRQAGAAGVVPRRQPAMHGGPPARPSQSAW
ncbi:hypothetical protein [Acanthopleuribacter pedis]|uniref:Uncharacterized protein n=1 Tax=Acanthopleuribacter pedis TaxID=442870 RepID=A0A8J7QBS7_9BACT|nr:hypothetical protein [Acanthopleuribacter pedis]MBO1318071.1 hypothetical protein [Acanthopleuribacter pedis]